MDLKFAKTFDRAFEKLERNKQKDVMETIRLFRENPTHSSLLNHPLHGSMSGKRSISAGPNLRIIFVERGGYIQVLMLDVGDHNAVYFD